VARALEREAQMYEKYAARPPHAATEPATRSHSSAVASPAAASAAAAAAPVDPRVARALEREAQMYEKYAAKHSLQTDSPPRAAPGSHALAAAGPESASVPAAAAAADPRLARALEREAQMYEKYAAWPPAQTEPPARAAPEPPTRAAAAPASTAAPAAAVADLQLARALAREALLYEKYAGMPLPSKPEPTAPFAVRGERPSIDPAPAREADYYTRTSRPVSDSAYAAQARPPSSRVARDYSWVEPPLAAASSFPSSEHRARAAQIAADAELARRIADEERKQLRDEAVLLATRHSSALPERRPLSSARYPDSTTSSAGVFRSKNTLENTFRADSGGFTERPVRAEARGPSVHASRRVTAQIAAPHSALASGYASPARPVTSLVSRSNVTSSLSVTASSARAKTNVPASGGALYRPVAFGKTSRVSAREALQAPAPSSGTFAQRGAQVAVAAVAYSGGSRSTGRVAFRDPRPALALSSTAHVSRYAQGSYYPGRAHHSASIPVPVPPPSSARPTSTPKTAQPRWRS
jgi:hypothetical protein